MPPFVATLEFRFEAESLESVGRELRRLQQVASPAGFELVRGTAAPAPPDEPKPGGWTSYPPLDPRRA
ncbi:MAG: hypothetical protein ICV64_11135 [Thermoleophilia bacterium]|nr:hypothetical protein [Thermoleophilia bacterium]